MQSACFDDLLMASLPFILDTLNISLGGVVHTGHFSFPVATQYNISTASGHVGGYRYMPRTSSLGNDLCLRTVMFRVEDLVGNARLLHQLRDKLGAFHRSRAYQHRTALLLAVLNVFNNGFKLFFLGQIYQVVKILTCNRPMGRNNGYIQAINLTQFESFGICGSRHA